MRRRLFLSLACVGTVITGLLSGAAPASATVSQTAAGWTPDIRGTSSTVHQLVQCGPTMYAVGTFTQVAKSGTIYNRNNAFSFSATNGTVTSWDPNVNGTVNSIALSQDCSTAYLGGRFTAVGTAKVTDLAEVTTGTGSIVSGFAHTTNGMVNTIVTVRAGSVLLVGGNFTTINGASRGYYASLDPSTGAVTNYLTLAVAGQLTGSTGGTKVFNQQVSQSGSRLLFEGNFTTVEAQPRQQLVEVDLGATAATLDPWYDSTLNSTSCIASEAFYARAAAFSADEQTIYMATTGAAGSSPYCDAVVAFTNTAPATVKWTNLTGRDSLYAVAAGAGDDVYIAGHERWADNPLGKDDCGSGCVDRPGIGDISASSGLATSWNPTRSRGQGADDLLITPAGLWVASDTFDDSTTCAQAYHPGICFLPGTA